jgi:NADPH:quinone reductase
LRTLRRVSLRSGVSHRDIKVDSPEGTAGIRTGAKEFAYVFFRLFTRGLQDGWFTPHPYQVIPGGLNGVEEGLTNLKAGKASAVNYVYKIEDTESDPQL